jgi:uncharacterized protein
LKVFYKDTLISDDIIIADSFFKKLKGLMFCKNFKTNKGVFFSNSNWIHTFFMLFSIDVLYLDSSFKVVSYIKDLKPWSFTLPRFKAKHLIEFKANTLKKEELYLKGDFKCLDFYV